MSPTNGTFPPNRLTTIPKPSNDIITLVKLSNVALNPVNIFISTPSFFFIRKRITSFYEKLIKEGDEKEGGFQLLRVNRGIPKNKALIKYLSEEGVRQILQKTENHYMSDNNREMPKVDAELYYVIDEKNNQIELSDKGVDYLSGTDDPDFFVMPEIGVKIAQIEAKDLSSEEEASQKEVLFREFGVKSERIHTMSQLLKAYSLFEKDTQYVVMDNKVMIVDESTGRIMDGRRYSDGLHQACLLYTSDAADE